MMQPPIDSDSNIEEFDILLQESGMLPKFHVLGAPATTILEGLRSLELNSLNWHHIDLADPSPVGMAPTSGHSPSGMKAIFLAATDTDKQVELYLRWHWNYTFPEGFGVPRYDVFVSQHEPTIPILRHFNKVHGTNLYLRHQQRSQLIPRLAPLGEMRLRQLAGLNSTAELHSYEWDVFHTLVHSMKVMRTAPSGNELRFLLLLNRVDNSAVRQFVESYYHLRRYLHF